MTFSSRSILIQLEHKKGRDSAEESYREDIQRDQSQLPLCYSQEMQDRRYSHETYSIHFQDEVYR